MPITSPVPIDAGPAVPSSSTPEATFDAQYEAFNSWERNQLQPGANALAANVFANATDAAASAATATTQAELATTNGAAQVTLATTQAGLATTNGAAQVTLATTQADNAAASASTATTQAGIATTQAAASGVSAAASEASRIAASKLNLGNKASAPTLDNQGAALLAGAAYYDTVLNKWRVWTGAAWGDGISAVAGVSSVNGLIGDVALKTLNGGALTGTGDLVIDSPVFRSARTSNTALTTADKGKLIDITSGTFTQTFVAAATLGDGWWCYIKNSGDGDITLDPNGVETIDALASYVMYPGEVRFVQCDGVALRSIVTNSFLRVFTASGTFIKPPGYSRFASMVLSAGGGGNSNALGGGGGGGGAFPVDFRQSAIGATASVVIGAGGTVDADGGSSSFAGVTVTGGSPGSPGSGGTGGGVSPLVGNVNPDGFGRPSGNTAGVYGGGGGGTGSGFVSTYGGGGGGGGVSSGGSSVFAGSGGRGNGSGTGTGGTAPSGGGGSQRSGARGEVRITGVI